MWDKSDKLVVRLSWIDGNLCVGDDNIFKLESEKLASKFEVEEIGPLVENVGYKLQIETKANEGKEQLKLRTEPVLMQRDAFNLPNKESTMVAIAGLVLTKGEIALALSSDMQTKHRSGVSKLLHIMRWS